MGRLGLEVLSEGRKGGKLPLIDIIAVHGLNGDSYSTWTHESGYMWLKDCLPLDLPWARIMTFGYDANVRGTSLNGFRESANALLGHLQDARHTLLPEAINEGSGRPIVFICHSLGGIVVKQAIVKASRDQSFKDIRASTFGILFLATPHRGSHAASVGKLMSNIAKMVGLDISSTHLEELLPGSRGLQGLSNDFCKVIADPEIEVLNFFEDQKLKVGVSSIVVVPQMSAVMDPIGSVKEGISLHGDHRQICRFSSRNDSQYCLLRRRLIDLLSRRIQGPLEWREKSPPGPSDAIQNILSWMQFQTPVKEVAADGTCTWIEERIEFQQWRNSRQSTILWINGPPGIGKTMLASYIFEHLETEPVQVSILDAGVQVQSKSSQVHYLVRGIVKQVLEKNLPILEDSLETLRHLQKEYPNVNDMPFHKLLFLLSRTIFQASSIDLILDGLDKLETASPEVEQLLNSILKQCAVPSLRFKVLLISRDDPFLRDILASHASLAIRPEDTIPDILRYVRSRIKVLRHLQSCAARIEEAVVEKSRGLFLWVKYFMTGLEDLRNISDIYDYIDNTKGGLSDTYQDIMEKLEAAGPGFSEWRRKILTYTAASFRSLKISEVEEAIAIEPGSLKIDTHKRLLGGWDTIQAACGSLLQQHENGSVEHLHPSSREFILTPSSRIAFPSLPKTDEEAHQEMAEICMTYLCFTKLEASLTGDPGKDNQTQLEHPFLEYASLYWPQHLIKSGNLPASLLQSLERFITSLSGITWAVSYFPYFTCQAGESLLSAFGLLQTLIAQVVVCVRKTSISSISLTDKTNIAVRLDEFLIRSFERAVSLEAHDSGPAARETIERRLDLCKVYHTMLDFSRAQKVAFETYTFACSLFGDFDALTLRCRHEEILLEMELELIKEVRSFGHITSSFQSLLAPLEEQLGPFHTDTLRCHHDVGYSMTCEGRLQEGLEILQIVLEQMREHLGEGSALTQRTVVNVANTLYNLDRYDEVEGILCSNLEVRNASRPKLRISIEACHPYTFRCLSILAMNLYMQDDYERSVTMYERSMTGRQLLFGEGDETLLRSARNFGLVYEAQGKYRKASEHYTKWLAVAKRHGRLVKAKELQNAINENMDQWKEAIKLGIILDEDSEIDIRTYTRNWFRSYRRGDCFVILGMAVLILGVHILLLNFWI